MRTPQEIAAAVLGVYEIITGTSDEMVEVHSSVIRRALATAAELARKDARGSSEFYVGAEQHGAEFLEDFFFEGEGARSCNEGGPADVWVCTMPKDHPEPFHIAQVGDEEDYRIRAIWSRKEGKK